MNISEEISSDHLWKNIKPDLLDKEKVMNMLKSSSSSEEMIPYKLQDISDGPKFYFFVHYREFSISFFCYMDDFEILINEMKEFHKNGPNKVSEFIRF